MNLLYAITIGALFAIGVYQLLRRDVIKAAFGLFILFNGTNLLLLLSGALQGVVAPFLDFVGQPSDPLVQALILTAVVIGFGVSALLMSLLYWAYRRYRSSDMDELTGLER